MKLVSRFVGSEDRHRMGSWTELVELRESRALEARNQNWIGSSEVSARFLLDLVVPRYQLLWIPTFGHIESVRESSQGPGAREEKGG